jgi:hypothetical protein
VPFDAQKLFHCDLGGFIYRVDLDAPVNFDVLQNISENG